MNTGLLLNCVDSIYYDWKDNRRVSLKRSGVKKRLIETRNETYAYLDRFLKGIGGKSKLK